MIGVKKKCKRCQCMFYTTTDAKMCEPCKLVDERTRLASKHESGFII